MADEPAGSGKGLVVEDGIEEILREIGAKRAAHLHRLHRAAGDRAAADLIHQFAQRQAEGGLVKAAMLQVAGELDRDGAMGAADAEVAVELGAAVHDDWDRGERHDVVDDRRLAEQALQRGQRRFGADDAALAFEAVEERGFLAADISARTNAHFHVEGMRRAQHRCAQNALAPGNFNGLLHHRNGMRIFGAGVDIALGGTHGDGGNRHALDQHEGITLHDHPVGKGAAVAFIGVADDVFLVCLGVCNGLPLDAGRKACAAAPAQAAVGDLLHDLGRRHGNGRLKALQTLVVAVVLQRQRIGDAAAGEGEACLALEEGDFRGEAMGEPVRAAGQEPGIEQGRHIRGLHRTIGHTALFGAHLDQHFQPQHAA